MTNLVLQFSDPNKSPIVLPEYGRDVSTPFVFDGYYSTRYAQSINQALLHLLENFAGPNPPLNPVVGQLWYDNVHQELKNCNTNYEWKTIGGIEFSETEPTNQSLWFNIADNYLYVWVTGQYVKVGGNFFHLDGDNYSQTGSPPIDFSPPLNRIYGPVIITESLSIDGDLNINSLLTTEKLNVLPDGRLDINVLGISFATSTTEDQWGDVGSFIRFDDKLEFNLYDTPGGDIYQGSLLIHNLSSKGLQINGLVLKDDVATINGVYFLNYTSVLGYSTPEGWIKGVKDEPLEPTSLVPFSVLRTLHEALGGIPPDGVERNGSTPMTGPLKSTMTQGTEENGVPNISLIGNTSTLTLKGTAPIFDYTITYDGFMEQLNFEHISGPFLTLHLNDTTKAIDFLFNPVINVVSNGKENSIINIEEADEILTADFSTPLVDGRAVAWCIFEAKTGTIIKSYNIDERFVFVTYVSSFQTPSGQYSFVLKPEALKGRPVEDLVTVVTSAAGLLQKGQNEYSHNDSNIFTQGNAGTAKFQHLRILPFIYTGNKLFGSTIYNIHVQMIREETQYKWLSSANTEQYFRSFGIDHSAVNLSQIYYFPTTAKYITFACYNKTLP